MVDTISAHAWLDSEMRQLAKSVGWEEEGENMLRVVVSRIDAQEFAVQQVSARLHLVVDHVDPAQLAMPVDAVGPVGEMMDALRRTGGL